MKSPVRKRVPRPEMPKSPREERAEARRKKREIEIGILESKLREAKKNRTSMGRGKASAGESHRVVELESSVEGEEVSVKGKEKRESVRVVGEYGSVRGDRDEGSVKGGNDEGSVRGDVGSVRVPDAGSVRVGDAGSVRVGDAGSMRVGDAGSVRVGDSGSVRGNMSSVRGENEVVSLGDEEASVRGDEARDRAFEMWLQESDPDDVDFNGDEIETSDQSVTITEDGGTNGKKRDSKKDAEDGQEAEPEPEGEEKYDSEDSEDLMDRFEFEVEEDVADFVDEFSIGRREIPDSSSDEEDPIVERNRKIRRMGRGDRLLVGNSYLSAVDFREAVLDYALSTGFNIRQQKNEKKKISFICGMGGKCKWRVYCSYDGTKQLWYVRSRYFYHNCTPNGKCRYIQAPVIARLFMDKLRLNPLFMPAQIQDHMKEQWKIVSTRAQCQGGRLRALQAIEKEYADQFAHIRGYAEEILDSTPGSTVVVETVANSDGADVFQGIYICFHTIRTSWKGSCRPIIGREQEENVCF